MRMLAHLQEYTLTLTTLSPVFIGSGNSYQKTEYLFDPVKKMVHFIDKNCFFQFLSLRNYFHHIFPHIIISHETGNFTSF